MKKLFLALLVVMAMMTGCSSTSNEKADEVQDAPEVQEVQMAQEVEVLTDAVNEQNTEQDELTDNEEVEDLEEADTPILNENDSEIDANNAPEQSEPVENNPDYNVTGADNNTTSTQSNAGAGTSTESNRGTGSENVATPSSNNNTASNNNTETPSNNSSSVSGITISSGENASSNHSRECATGIDGIDNWVNEYMPQYTPEEAEEIHKKHAEQIANGEYESLSDWAQKQKEIAAESRSTGDSGLGVNIAVGGGADSTSDSTGE